MDFAKYASIACSRFGLLVDCGPFVGDDESKLIAKTAETFESILRFNDGRLVTAMLNEFKESSDAIFVSAMTHRTSELLDIGNISTMEQDREKLADFVAFHSVLSEIERDTNKFTELVTSMPSSGCASRFVQCVIRMTRVAQWLKFACMDTIRFSGHPSSVWGSYQFPKVGPEGYIDDDYLIHAIVNIDEISKAIIYHVENKNNPPDRHRFSAIFENVISIGDLLLKP